LAKTFLVREERENNRFEIDRGYFEYTVLRDVGLWRLTFSRDSAARNQPMIGVIIIESPTQANRA